MSETRISNVDSIAAVPSGESSRVEHADATPKRGLKIKRHFTNSENHPFEELEWDRRDATIYNERGETIFEQKDIEVPESWSQLATDIGASKYLRKAGVPGTGNEVSMRQLVRRVARTIRRSGEEFGGYFGTPDDAEAFESELTYLLISQRGAFNSPVWFNCGLWHEYGIEGGGGNFFWDRATQNRPDNDECVRTPAKTPHVLSKA